MSPREIDALYGLPLGEFTAARNELAKRTGDASIKALKKPSISAWAINQLARTRELDLRRLVNAGEQLEQAQREAVRTGDQKAFDKARRDEREAVRRLRSAAAEILREGGHTASDATLDRIARTLNAAAATKEGRELLREGRLTEDVEPQAFDALLALASAAPKRKATAKKTERADEKKSAERAKAARSEADDLDAKAREAEREAKRLRDRAKRAAERAERLRGR